MKKDAIVTGTARGWLFFALTVAWASPFWAAAAHPEWFADLTRDRGLVFGTLMLVGGFGPASAAVFLLYAVDSPEARRDYWSRLVDFRRVANRGGLAAALLPLLLVGLGALAVWLRAGGWPYSSHYTFLISQFPPLVLLAVPMLVLMALSAEMGWRGYLLELCLERWRPLSASLIVGIGTAVWLSIPLLLSGVVSAPIDTASSFNLLLQVSPLSFQLIMSISSSIVLTWIYVHTRHSTLATVLFQCMLDLSLKIVGLPNEAYSYWAVWLIVAACLIAAFGFRKPADSGREAAAFA